MAPRPPRSMACGRQCVCIPHDKICMWGTLTAASSACVVETQHMWPPGAHLAGHDGHQWRVVVRLPDQLSRNAQHGLLACAWCSKRRDMPRAASARRAAADSGWLGSLYLGSRAGSCSKCTACPSYDCRSCAATRRSTRRQHSLTSLHCGPQPWRPSKAEQGREGAEQQHGVWDGHARCEALTCRCCRKSSVPMCCVLVQGGCFLCTCGAHSRLLMGLHIAPVGVACCSSTPTQSWHEPSS